MQCLSIVWLWKPTRKGRLPLFCTHLPCGIAQGNEQPSVSHLEKTFRADQRTSPLLIKDSTVFELKILTAVAIQKKFFFFLHNMPNVMAYITSVLMGPVASMHCIFSKAPRISERDVWSNRQMLHIFYVILSFTKQLIFSNMWEVPFQPFLLVIFDVLILATKSAIRPAMWSPFILACLFPTLLMPGCWIEKWWGFLRDRLWSHVQSSFMITASFHVQCLLLPWWHTPSLPASAFTYSENYSESSHFQEKCPLLWWLLNTAVLASSRRIVTYPTDKLLPTNRSVRILGTPVRPEGWKLWASWCES